MRTAPYSCCPHEANHAFGFTFVRMSGCCEYLILISWTILFPVALYRLLQGLKSPWQLWVVYYKKPHASKKLDTWVSGAQKSCMKLGFSVSLVWWVFAILQSTSIRYMVCGRWPQFSMPSRGSCCGHIQKHKFEWTQDPVHSGVRTRMSRFWHFNPFLHTSFSFFTFLSWGGGREIQKHESESQNLPAWCWGFQNYWNRCSCWFQKTNEPQLLQIGCINAGLVCEKVWVQDLIKMEKSNFLKFSRYLQTSFKLFSLFQAMSRYHGPPQTVRVISGTYLSDALFFKIFFFQKFKKKWSENEGPCRGHRDRQGVKRMGYFFTLC